MEHNRLRHRDQYRLRRVGGKILASALVVMALGILATTVLMDSDGVSRTQIRSMWQGALALRGSRAGTRRTKTAEHPIYPYSIVAGGIHSQAEFEAALRTDPVAAAHYANFNAAKFRLIKLQHSEHAYVSFRVGNNVYWTSHPVELRAGEMLISDGEHLGRTRCGNRVSATPRLPVLNHEPTGEQLNSPVLPKVETEAFTAENPLSGASPGAFSPRLGGMVGPREAGPVGAGGLSTPGYGGLYGLAPVPNAGCPSGDEDVNGKCTTSSPTPPAPAPENDSWVLLLTGGGLLAGYSLIRQRQIGWMSFVNR